MLPFLVLGLLFAPIVLSGNRRPQGVPMGPGLPPGLPQAGTGFVMVPGHTYQVVLAIGLGFDQSANPAAAQGGVLAMLAAQKLAPFRVEPENVQFQPGLFVWKVEAQYVGPAPAQLASIPALVFLSVVEAPAPPLESGLPVAPAPEPPAPAGPAAPAASVTTGGGFLGVPSPFAHHAHAPFGGDHAPAAPVAATPGAPEATVLGNVTAMSVRGPLVGLDAVLERANREATATEIAQGDGEGDPAHMNGQAHAPRAAAGARSPRAARGS